MLTGTQIVVAFLSRFINARRRIVQPMIDQTNRAGKSHRTSKLGHLLHTLLSSFITWPVGLYDSVTQIPKGSYITVSEEKTILQIIR